MEKLKVIFHISDPGRWKVALNNTRNFLNNAQELEAEWEAEILVNAAGVNFFLAEFNPDLKSFWEQLKSLANEGVVLASCRNALKAHKIAEASLPSFIKIVPAGITELIFKQQEGFAYIKP